MCRGGAVIRIAVPHPRHNFFLDDPTHVRAITPHTMQLFSKRNCEEWKRVGASNSPLALYAGVDESVRYTLPVSPLSIAERALDLVLAKNPKLKVVMLGGDHSNAWPAVAALARARGPRFGIVQIDAHTDLLAERLGVKYCFATWSYHANDLLGRHGKMVQVGIRASGRDQQHWESTQGVRQFWAEQIRDEPERALEQVLQAAKATQLPVYLSNDIDGTDDSVADACGTPEPAGLEPEWLEELIDRLGKEVGLAGADLMEVAPLLGADQGAKTLQLAARYARSSLNALLA